MFRFSRVFVFAFAASLVGCSSNSIQKDSFKSAAEKPVWITESNKIAESYSRSWADIVPESGSGLGYREYDSRATRLDDQLENRIQRLRDDWIAKLKVQLKQATDPEVVVDIKVLLDNLEQGVRGYELDQKYGEIPFSQVANSVFYSMQELINDQSPADRKAAAVDRFNKYVRGFVEDGKPSRSAVDGAMHETEKKLKLFALKNGPSGGRRFLPLRADIESYLKDSKKVVEGIADILKMSGRNDWQEDYKLFKSQMVKYDVWLRKTLLPIARRDHKLPRDIYAWILWRMGNRSTPEETRAVARREFAVGLKEYAAVAAEIAKRDGLKDSSPKAVIAHLKKDVETNPEKILALYERANLELSADIKKRDLVTLPSAPLRIRLASEAESRIQPVPHLDTPPLIGNSGERPEFIVPIASAGKMAFDDFSFKAAAKSLTAHEGRPGHDLQFSTALDRGVSTIRATYAFNSVNVEGWALYAEWLMEPSLSLDEKMALLMSRMMRNARMFLDPELHLGLITPAEAKKVITEQVAMSPEWADLELQRYLFKGPAQAPSYYYGYLKLREIRDETMQRLGAKFRERCFHDAIMNEGLLPLDILAEKIRALTCP